MSIGHFRHEAKTKGEVYLILGEADTSAIYAKTPRVDFEHDIAYGGGVSIDGRTVYIDRELHAEVMHRAQVPQSRWVVVRGMDGKQIIACWVEHEHTEKSVADGDNPIDVYSGCHGVATFKEEEGAEVILGRGQAERYETAIKPALERCLKRFKALGTKANPPKDLWCGPYLDEPDDDDREIIRIMRARGVVDAFKMAKSAVHYGVAGRNCRDCSMMVNPSKDLSTCKTVSGLVRWNRQCDEWATRK